MKTRILPVLLVFTFALFGCFDVTEEIWLNKNRSGRYAMTISLGSGPIANMIKMMQEKTNDSLRALGQPPQKTDSLMRLAALPDSVKRRFPYPDVLDKTTIHLKMDKGLDYQFQYDFQRIEELSLFWENISAMDKLKEDSTLKDVQALKFPMLGEMKGSISGIPDMQFDGKTLRRTMKVDTTSQEIGQLFFEHGDDGFVKLLFRNKSYDLIFHMPKKVKSVSGTGLVKDGKTVHAKASLLDVMRNQSHLAGEIRL